MIAEVQLDSIPFNPYGIANYAGVRLSKEDFLSWQPDDNYVYEFRNGSLEPTTSMRQDENQFIVKIDNHFFTTQSFREGGRLRAEMDVWLTETLLRRPDLAYYSTDQQRRMATGNRVIPSFVIKFGSLSDTESISIKKRHEYFDAGVQVVWWVFPIYKEVVVYTSPINMTGHHGNDLLSAAPAVSDFQLTVAELFN